MTAALAIARSLDTRPLGRLFWKEYRQQRTLWLTLLALGLVGQLVLRLVLPFEREAVGVLFGVPLSMSVFYLIGSSAMLFALEREERTSDWLCSLAAPPGWTLLAKYGFVSVSTLALCAVMLLWTLVLTLGHPIPLFEPPYELGPEHQSTGTKFVGIGLFLGIVFLGFLAWGVLGSLTSRRVVTAVPAGFVWWIATFLVPFWIVLSFGPRAYAPGGRETVEGIGFGAGFLVAALLNVWLGWRWCLGKYIDAQFLDGFKELVSDDYKELFSVRLGWRKVTASRIPTRVEYEFTGWRTWQRLVWQERHRESLHLGLLAIVCSVGVLLALFRFGPNPSDSITFAVIGLIVPLPVAMGVLGFRFDAAGQQLRFLANRGSSPLAIWLAKQVVWLPRAFWIPAVAWGVACLAELLFIPSVPGGSFWIRRLGAGSNHNVITATVHMLPHWNAVLWFVLLSYAVGQLMAMLLRQFVIAAAASLLLSSVLAGWLALMVHYDVPRWWSVGGIVAWILLMTAWYSRHWLLERRTWPVFGRLSIGLLAPPLLVLGAVATYRWLEVPGGVLQSRWLFTLLYPREAERRGPMFKVTGESVDEGLTVEVERMKRPVTLEEDEVSKRFAALTGGFNTVEQFRGNLEASAGLDRLAMGMMGSASQSGDAANAEAEQPADALLANRDQRARDAFWTANESRLKEILEIAKRDRCGSLDRYFSLGGDDALMPQQRLLLEAAQLHMDEGLLKEALDCCCASLRLATFWASGRAWNDPWSGGDRQQAETLRVIVEWANHKTAANESLLPAIKRVREELARFPSVSEAVVAHHLRDVQSLKLMQDDAFQFQNQPDVFQNQPDVVLANFLPTEVARAQRVLDQQLYWRWHSLQFLASSLQRPGINAPRQFAEYVKQDAGFANDERLRKTTPLVWMTHPTLDEKVVQMIVNREVVIRETLLAMAMLEWKRVHHEMPDFLGSLAPYCVIEKQEEGGRVLPVMALNDPWTGSLFEYSGFWFRNIESRMSESRIDAPITIIHSAGPTPSGHAARSVLAVPPHVIDQIASSMGVSIQSRKGRLSLVIPPKPRAAR
ncbi:MAG: hypothetical protein AABP62_17790 [Planctomycetota bacterium]